MKGLLPLTLGIALFAVIPPAAVEVNPLLPLGTWDYFCLDNVLYHGKTLTIIWDKTGERYQKGKGLSVLADGKKIATATTLTRITGLLNDSLTGANH